VIACQSENNIPTIGKKYVSLGREMFWMRVDRYYVGTPDEPDAVHIPVMCQHCDNAPCETVCPVAATVHSPEGTNDMIYNRCVGTRYCSNNCPYKVRRFNWFNYPRMNPELAASPMHMQLNPEVTVRGRGVMEKCTFCTQRIHQAKSRAKLEDRKVKDGEIQTACQSSCPTGAIVFGDLNDENSQLRKMLAEPRYYGLLEDLNTRPAVQYASKIRNADVLKSEVPHKAKHHESHEEKGGHHA
jgi:molybdopterin-containing oxidoreductase family iron-sulfur binding subunit